MQRLGLWVAVLLVGSGVASAQSLAEVAKQEKDRRARTVEADEAPPVIGNKELENARGDGLSVMGSSEKGKTPSASSDEEPDPTVSREYGLTEKEVRDLRETWARVWPERLAAAVKELELAEDAVYQCQSAAHYVFVPLAIDCNGVFKRRAIAEYRLGEARQNRYNWELLLPERPERPERQPPPRKP